MKNRRLTIVAFLLCACLVVGFGYAVVSDTLDIQGTADVDKDGVQAEFNADVYFHKIMKAGVEVDAVVEGDALGYVANINAGDNDMAHFTITGLKAAGEEVTITYVVKNDNTNDVLLTKKNATSTEDIFTITTELDGGAKTVSAGSTTTVWVKVALNGDPADALTGAFTFGITAEPVTTP